MHEACTQSRYIGIGLVYGIRLRDQAHQHFYPVNRKARQEVEWHLRAGIVAKYLREFARCKRGDEKALRQKFVQFLQNGLAKTATLPMLLL